MRTTIIQFFAAFVVLTALTGCGSGNLTELKADYLAPRYYLCHYTASPLTMDGVMDEPIWDSVPWTDSFVDLFIDIKTPPPYDTKVKMLWDNTFFYFAAKMEEPHVRADFVTRDTVICLENDFEIFADPDGDNLDYFEFEMNARGTVWDLFLSRAYRDTVNPDNGWDIKGLKTGIRVDGTLNDASDLDGGWVTEIAIPWADMEFFAHKPLPPVENDQWRVNFLRVEYIPRMVDGQYFKDTTPANNSAWSPHHSTGVHDPESFGIVQFTKKPVGNAVLQPDPSLPARSILMQVYYAQKKYFRETGKYAASMRELGVVAEKRDGLHVPDRFTLHPHGYIATAELKEGGRTIRWKVNEISKLWAEE